MRNWRLAGFYGFGLTMAISIGQTAAAKPEFSATVPADCANLVQAEFPSGNAPKKTQWRMCWEQGSGTGVVIKYAAFRPSPASPYIEVLSKGMLGQIFVPYHPGRPRFFDVNFNFSLLELSRVDCPANRGQLLGSPKLVCKEIRDRGVAWKDDATVKRGEELVLWGVIDAANYNYIVEWTFRDDGTIVARAGSTGPKLGGADDTVGHMHTFTWQLDIDLAGAANDSVLVTKHAERGRAARDTESLLRTEGGVTWNPFHFTTLDIKDKDFVNANGRSLSYELLPLRYGSGRHSEAYTKKDFWVTAYKPNEHTPEDLPNYVNGERTANADVVVWYTGSAHHENGMRDEDRQTVPVKWTGFELSPQNMFSRTPFFPDNVTPSASRVLR